VGLLPVPACRLLQVTLVWLGIGILHNQRVSCLACRSHMPALPAAIVTFAAASHELPHAAGMPDLLTAELLCLSSFSTCHTFYEFCTALEHHIFCHIWHWLCA
jgi:hypothetical protein